MTALVTPAFGLYLLIGLLATPIHYEAAKGVATLVVAWSSLVLNGRWSFA